MAPRVTFVFTPTGANFSLKMVTMREVDALLQRSFTGCKRNDLDVGDVDPIPPTKAVSLTNLNGMGTEGRVTTMR